MVTTVLAAAEGLVLSGAGDELLVVDAQPASRIAAARIAGTAFGIGELSSQRDEISRHCVGMIPTRCQVKGAERYLLFPPMRRVLPLSVLAATLVISAVPAVTASASASAPETTAAASPAAAVDVSTTQVRKRNPKVAKGANGNRIRVSKIRRLPSGGSYVTVRGKGFDPRVGIYVGLCVKPAKGQKPSPCGGGVDTDGSTQASAWVSSNPPSYGSSLATPYGRNGSFKVRIYVSSRINATTDCRQVRCAVMTRADHTRAGDRSWDLAVPVRFKK